MMENANVRPPAESREALAVRRGERESVIDQECFFEGTFRTPGNMRIEGQYEGVIQCQGTLLIAESGRVNARIVAGSLTIAGQLNGEAQCDTRFEVLKSGRVSGAIATKSTVIHEGAFFEGEIRMAGVREAAGAPAQTSAAPAPPTPAVEAQAPAATLESRGATATAVERPSSTSGRRRPQADGNAAPPAADTAELREAFAPPTVNGNGRGFDGPGRDVLPNRTGEP